MKNIILPFAIILVVGGVVFYGIKKQKGEPQHETTYSVSQNSQNQNKNEIENESEDTDEEEKIENKTSQNTVTVPVVSNQPTTVLTMDEVKKHNSATSCFTVISGKVYDITNWINRHPGGQQAILSLCGKDGTDLFMSQHGGQTRPESVLRSFFIANVK